MKKILMLLLVCFCFYVPTVSAELYQNRDYNFQMDIPDGWGENEGTQSVLSRKVQEYKNGVSHGAGFSLKIDYIKGNSLSATTSSATIKEKKLIVDGIENALLETYPNMEITYSNSMYFGNNEMLVIKGKMKNSQGRMIVATALRGKNSYTFMFVTNDSGQYEQQFFDMLKTLRPIVGNNDADEWQEDVKYMRDVAEKEAIGAITNQKVTVKVK